MKPVAGSSSPFQKMILWNDQVRRRSSLFMNNNNYKHPLANTTDYDSHEKNFYDDNCSVTDELVGLKLWHNLALDYFFLPHAIIVHENDKLNINNHQQDNNNDNHNNTKTQKSDNNQNNEIIIISSTTLLKCLKNNKLLQWSWVCNFIFMKNKQNSLLIFF